MEHKLIFTIFNFLVSRWSRPILFHGSRLHAAATAALVLLPLVIFFFFFIKKWKKSEAASVNLPPGLPIIGNLHLISDPPFRCFRDLAQRYGPIMHLKLGEVDAVVVSSPKIAKEILRDNDPAFTDRPQSIALKILWYNYINVALCPYGDYWRQMRKICVVELLSARSVRSFASIRKDEVSRLVESLRLSAGEPVNLTEEVLALMSSVVCRAAFGKVCKGKDSLIEFVSQGLEMGVGFLIADIFPSSIVANALSWGTKRKLMRMRRQLDLILDHIIHEHEKNGAKGNGEFGNEDLVDVLLRIKESGELQFPIGYDNIKAVLFDMFTAGTETSASTIDWALAELMRNPRVMGKPQTEVREMMKEKGSGGGIEEEDIQKLSYLKLVIMETLRMHPQGAFIPRVSREPRQISGYTIPTKVKVLVNVWAIQRDPKYWDDPETFKPERFQNQSITLDFNGNDFHYLPFGSGKRMCPGVAFGSASVALPLAHLLYNFDWKLTNGVGAQDLNMIESCGLATSRKENLHVVAIPYQQLLP